MSNNTIGKTINKTLKVYARNRLTIVNIEASKAIETINIIYVGVAIKKLLFFLLSIAVANISMPGWIEAIGVFLISKRLLAVEPINTIFPLN